MNVIQEYVALAPYATIRIGGPARFFVSVASKEDIQSALSFAQEKAVPFFILAGGSNLLFLDTGFPGLVMFVAQGGHTIKDSVVTAWSGVQMQALVDGTIKRGLKGLEWAGGLPGSLGGAVRGNAGAFGGEIKDSVVSVTALSLETNEERVFTNEESQFSYRESFFKHHPEWFMTEIVLQLTEGGSVLALRAEADEHIQYRKDNHPSEPNCGSMFKNIIVDDLTLLPEELRTVSSVVKYGKIGAGVLIDQCGLKGAREGGAQISRVHANHIINTGDATSDNIMVLLNKAEEAVCDRFGITLEREVHIVTP